MNAEEYQAMSAALTDKTKNAIGTVLQLFPTPPLVDCKALLQVASVGLTHGIKLNPKEPTLVIALSHVDQTLQALTELDVKWCTEAAESDEDDDSEGWKRVYGDQPDE